MTNPNDRSFDQRPPRPIDPLDDSKNSLTQESGKHLPNQQDPLKKDPTNESGQHAPTRPDSLKKDPSHTDDSRQREREDLDQGEKRRAS